jgi:glycosyltransferase involved in cell wall biosynthesis
VKKIQLFALHLLSGRLLLELMEMRERYCKSLREVLMAAQGKLNSFRGRGLPLVTVCIPARNEERFIGQALYAIRKVNLYPRVEVIVIDQESTDNTVKIAEKFGAKVINVEYERNGKKLGVGISRHLGSLEAKGEIIVQIDADTLLTPFLIPRAVAQLSGDKIGVYYGAHYYYDGNLLLNLSAHYYDKFFRKPYNTPGYFMAYTKALYDHVQFDINAPFLHEDYVFGEQVFKRFGVHIFRFDKESIVLVSSRTWRRKGLLAQLNYVLTPVKGLL